MSDSESSVEFEEKVEQEQEAKVRELIERAKKTLPGYSEESLINIYRESFASENVFLNKLDIIIRQQRLLQEEANGDDEWHYSKKGEKPALQQRRQSPEKTREVRAKYNFLEDAKLIERALKHRRNEPQREKPQQFREKAEKKETQPRERQENNKEKVNQSFKEKKLLYKQKEENNGTVKHEQKPIVQLPEKVEKPAEKVEKTEKIEKIEKIEKVEKVDTVEKVEPKLGKAYAEKKQKYAQKKDQPKPQVKGTPKQQPKPVEVVPQQKKVENHIQAPEAKPVVPQQAPSPVKTQQAPKPTLKVEAAREPIVVEQKKVATAPVVVKTASVAPTPNEEPKVQSIKKIESQKEIKPLDPQVEKEFQKAVSQNSFILKFIKPSNKLQKVTYIRTPEGGCKEVKVREPLEQKN